MKYYAVKVGRKTGVYDSWDECKKLVNGYPGAVYKSFTNKSEAYDFVNLCSHINEQETTENSKMDVVIAYVDGSYIDNRYSYGCILFYNEKKYVLSGSGNDSEYVSMRNVAGEILGCINAISWAINHNAKKIEIYYDYEGIEKWALGLWKANKSGTIKYKEFISSISNEIDISFVKVAAHTGVEYNEEADILAKAELGLI